MNATYLACAAVADNAGVLQLLSDQVIEIYLPTPLLLLATRVNSVTVNSGTAEMVTNANMNPQYSSYALDSHRPQDSPLAWSRSSPRPIKTTI
jgi:hypothetical protein